MKPSRQNTIDLDEQDKTKGENKVRWAKISSISTKLQSQDLFDNEITIGRNSNNKIVIQDQRLSGTHCKLIYNSQNGFSQLEDLSTNGTFINDIKIGKGNSIQLQNGDNICILHKSKVPEAEQIFFVISLFKKNDEQESQNLKQKEEIKDDKEPDQQQKKTNQDDFGQELECSICLEVIYQCVTVNPCLHNFCGDCYSDWMQKSKDCPQCRKKVISVQKNPMINNIINKYIEKNPDKQRSKDECEKKDKCNKITVDVLKFDQDDKEEQKKNVVPPVQPAAIIQPAQNLFLPIIPPIIPIINRPQRGRKQPAAGRLFAPAQPPSENSQSDDSDSTNQNWKTQNECRECTHPRKVPEYFKCKRNQVHQKCHACGNLIPDRGNNEKYKQSCMICSHFFCNLYFNNQCKKGGKNIPSLSELQDHPVPAQITNDLFRENKHEANILKNYMKDNQMKTKDIMDYMNKKFLLKNNFEYKITKGMIKDVKNDVIVKLGLASPICSDCWKNVWFQLAFQFRRDIKDDLPEVYRFRDDCEYGINCWTMWKDDGHALNVDHICEQTLFK